MRVFLATTHAWYLGQTAKAFSNRQALAGIWMGAKNRTGIPPDQYRRCWAFHLAMKPFYHVAPQIWEERAAYWFSGLYRVWLRARLSSAACPKFDVAQAIMGFASDVFHQAEKVGALKVIDCPNSHPVTYYGFWQRECDLWCPGEKVPIPRWMFRRMTRELERADVVLCPSTFVRDTMILNGIPEARCFVNPFGVDVSVFKRRVELPAKPRFICCGTICVRKGHQYLFRAFEIVKRALPDSELICVGTYKQDFRKERPRWEGTFTFIPGLDHQKLAELLRTCTAFVFPSQEEGFARVLVEAMASGLPIIASHESGATTIVRDGVAGIIVNGRNPQEIAEAMLRLAGDRELNLKMSEAAFQEGSARNTWQDYGDRLLAHYSECLKRKPDSE